MAGESAGLSNASASMNIIATGASLLSSAMSASANRASARAQMDALKREKRYNIGLMEFEKRERSWIDMMTAWSSGTNTAIGTSTYGAMMSNQDVLQKEIDFQSEMYDTQIGMAKKQSKQRFLGIF
jgi:hypothetical protein